MARTRRMGGYVGSEAADCVHDGVDGGLGAAGVKALRPYGRPCGPALTPAQA
jgi:hypothetical protein